MYDPSQKLFATPHTQATLVKVKRARTATSTTSLSLPKFRVTVTVDNFVALMYCPRLRSEQEVQPVMVTVPQVILDAAMSKLPPTQTLLVGSLQVVGC
jgi:hypothetical protein